MRPSISTPIRSTLTHVARFYDSRKVGDVGPLGFRRSTDLATLLTCLDRLVQGGVVEPQKTRFLDLGCADGRVNVFLSYVVRISVGIELDQWTYEEYAPLRSRLETDLGREGLRLPPENIFLFHGDATHEGVHNAIGRQTGVGFEDFDLFYTYLVMHEEFAGLIRERGKAGARFMVYGLDKILPRYRGFRLMDGISPMERILAVYEKE
jgi:hypothetical protein